MNTFKPKVCAAFATEVSLFEALCQMNSKAYQCLYDQCYASVEHFIVQNSGTKDDAADYFQNSLATFCVNVKEGNFQLRSDTKIATYVIEICRRQWYSYLRSRHFQVSKSHVDNSVIEISSELDSGIAEEYSPLQISRLQHALGKLGDTCQKILQLFYVENQSIKQIAEALDSTEGTIKVSRHRCTEQLRKHFGKPS
jgi:RNA polymerase sigma factor (sigma-70 family)